LGKEFGFNAARRVLLVAGGAGIAALAPIALKLADKAAEVHLVYGTRSSAEAPPENVMRMIVGENIATTYATEDGSIGFHGTAVDALAKLELSNYDLIVAAGPKPMLCNILKHYGYLHDKLFIAVETYVKCGLGFCGKCIVPGLNKRLCVDGMFYRAKELLRGWLRAECK
jgi:dihydroorotate dehydrogenase electron transfer subunit